MALTYTLTGLDLPKLYKGRQDPLLHYGDSWYIAEGKGWVAKVSSRGEIRAYKGDDRITPEDLAQEYDTDEKLSLAISTGEISLGNNNWYEVEFYKRRGDRLWYLDLMADDTVCFSFDEALEVFGKYMNDEKFVDELRKELRKDY